MSRNITNTKNKLKDGNAISITNNIKSSIISVDFKNNTTESTTPNDNDLLLIADSTGKIIKRIQVSNLDSRYTATDPINISASNVISLKNLSGFGSNGQFLKTNGSDTVSWATPTDTNHWNIFETRKIKPSTSSVNYLFLENTTTDNALNPKIELKSDGGNSLIYDAKTDPAFVVERNSSYFKLYQTGVFEFINNQKLSILNNTGASTRLELHYDSSNKFNIKVPVISSDIDLTIPSTSGNLCLDVGSTNITTLGTITSGTWSGTTIAVNKGGTGQTSFINGQILIGNTTGNTLTKSTLTAGSNITITNSAGAITIAAASATVQIESAVNVSTSNILGNPLRTFGNSSSSTRIAGFDVAIDTIKTQSESNFGIIFDYWTGSTYAAGKSIKPFDYGDGTILYELDHPIITGDTGVPSRIGFKDLNLSNYIFLDVPDISSNIAITLPSSAGTLALTSQIPSSVSGGKNITIVDNVVNLDANIIDLSDLETSGCFFVDNNAPNGGFVIFTTSHTSGYINSSYNWMMMIGGSGDLHFENNNATGTSTFSLRGYVGTSASSGSFKQMNFTGSHRCITENQSILNNIDDYIGMVVCATGNYNVIIPEGDDKTEISVDEAQPIVELSSTAKCKRVYGVISNKEQIGKSRNFGAGLFMSVANEIITIPRLIINSLGEGGVLVCNQNGNIENGDLLCSSDIQGLAMKQDSDFIMNYTIGKATQNYNFINDLDYKLIGIVYYCG